MGGGGFGVAVGKGPFGYDYPTPVIGGLATTPVQPSEPEKQVERPKPPVLSTGRKIRESKINQENTHGNT